MRESERAAELLGVTAPIRIDVRRYKDSPDSRLALFDVNMKPVCCHCVNAIETRGHVSGANAIHRI